MINYYNAVNVYTDSSITQDIDGTFISCSGFVTVIDNEIVDKGYKILYNSTNNHGELYAVYLGLQNLLKYRCYPNIYLNLFSDSKISIFGLTHWIYNWVQNMNSDLLLSSSGTPVKNQDLYANIIYYIVQNNTHLSMFHQLGHMNCKKIKDINLTIDKFRLYNNENISEDIAREICYYNNYVDNTSREILLNTVKNESFNKNNYTEPTCIAQHILNNNIINTYNELIN